MSVAYLLLLFVDMSNLEPDILLRQRTGRVGDNVLETLDTVRERPSASGFATYVETLAELLLLLVYYTKPEVDFIGLLKIGLHAHHLRECFLGML